MSTESPTNPLPDPPRAKVLKLVVPSDTASRSYVEVLEGWLEVARAGRLTGLVVAGIVDGDAETQFEGTPLETLGMLEVAKAHVLESLDEE